MKKVDERKRDKLIKEREEKRIQHKKRLEDIIMERA